MDIDELDVLDDDLSSVQSEPPVAQNDTTEEPVAGGNNNTANASANDRSALDMFLETKGINDSEKIKFENEDGSIEERSWKDLTEEEKLNILGTQQDTSDTDLDDSEIDLINRLRLSNMSVEDYLNSIRYQGASAYANAQAANQKEDYVYTVDDLTDEELYVLDLQARVNDITDEELQEALERAKSNEDLFQKEVAGLREDYKRMEDQRNQQQEALAEQEKQEQFAAFSSSIVDGINSFTSIGDLDITMNDNDKDTLYNFITGVDSAGVNLFAKALSDPETIVKTAWFALHGEDIINSISDYYKSQIQTIAKANYQKGLNAAKSQNNKGSKVVIKQHEKSAPRTKSIDDLD